VIDWTDEPVLAEHLYERARINEAFDRARVRILGPYDWAREPDGEWT
jgi:hypothetical protein